MAAPIYSIYKSVIFFFTIVNCKNLHDFLGLNEPFFNQTADAVFTAQEGSTAFLSCQIYNLNNKSVSWIRGRDSHILTVEQETFISDLRFASSHKKHKMSDTVTLTIHKVRMDDQGRYECQVSAQPKVSKWVELVVLRPAVKILGNPDIHVKEGSDVKIRCVISNFVEAPPFVSWFINNKMLVDMSGQTPSLTHSSNGHSVSTLHLHSVDPEEDSGNYSCQPASLSQVTVTLHVLRSQVKDQQLTAARNEGESPLTGSAINKENNLQVLNTIYFLLAHSMISKVLL